MRFKASLSSPHYNNRGFSRISNNKALLSKRGSLCRRHAIVILLVSLKTSSSFQTLYLLLRVNMKNKERNSSFHFLHLVNRGECKYTNLRQACPMILVVNNNYWPLNKDYMMFKTLSGGLLREVSPRRARLLLLHRSATCLLKRWLLSHWMKK